MTTIRKNIDIDAPAAHVWDVVRDVGAIHTRFTPGFVTDTRLEPGARVVVFANGLEVRELIIDVNEELRRLAYCARSKSFEHHSASFEVVSLSSTRTRLIWTTDVLPDAAADLIRPMIEQGSIIIHRTLSKAV
jgi:Polyketide cyclase / dehydrase and lipid transport